MANTYTLGLEILKRDFLGFFTVLTVHLSAAAQHPVCSRNPIHLDHSSKT